MHRHPAIPRRIAPITSVVAVLALGAAAASCNLVLGLDTYKNCPQDPGCPGTGGSGSGPTCTDGEKNGQETDVDCGGSSCSRCADGKACDVGSDCAGGTCSAGECHTPTCTDGEKNGNETDVDCGGPACAKCADDKGCNNGSDCTSKVCTGGTCVAPACGDLLQNGDETDVDCGGGTCGKCDVGKGCAADADCKGGSCGADMKCAATCTDGVKDGDETDTDCGGASCPKCAVTEGCATGPDCETGVCQGGACVDYFVWAKKFGGSGETCGNVVADSLGGIYITGSTTGSIDFGGGVMSPTAGRSMFAANLAAAGNTLWGKVYDTGGVSTDSARGIALALNTYHYDHVIAVGNLVGTLNIGPGTALIGNSQFVADLSGATWGNVINAGLLYSEVGGVATDPLSGDVLVTGTFNGSLKWNGNKIGAFGINAAGQHDIYLVRTTLGGSFASARTFGVSGNHTRAVVAVDGTGNVGLAGGINGTLQFGSDQISSVGTGLYGSNIFVAKLDVMGNALWSKRVGDVDGQVANAVAFDAGGNMLVTGNFAGTGDFGNGVVTSAYGDIFVAKYDPNGMLLWVKLFGVSGQHSANALAVDDEGNIALAGSIDGTIDFGAGALTSNGSGDAFVAKLDPNGGYVWARSFGDEQPQAVTGVAFSGTQHVVIAGTFASKIDFGGGVLTGPAAGSIFVAKLLVP